MTKQHATPVTKPIKLTRPFQVKLAVFLILLQILSMGGFATGLYLIFSQEMSKSFFSAHRDLQRIWTGMVPTIVIGAAAAGIITILVGLFGLLRFKRSVERSGERVISFLEEIGRGEMRGAIAEGTAPHLEPLAITAGATLASLQEHIQEVKTTTLELQRTVMRLNYLAADEGQITVAEVKALSSNLSNLSRELTNSLKWFEI